MKEKGPNTGGMGAYSPAVIINKKLEKKIIERIIQPTLKALKKFKKPYKGFLYVGLMIKDNNPYLIEFNVRMGDPECQVIIPRLKSDLVKIFYNSVCNKLKQTKIKWLSKKSLTIVLCAKGYPGNYQKTQIKSLEKIKQNRNKFIFHAGTKLINGKLISNGGRVLNFTGIGNNFLSIRNKMIILIKKLNWKNGFFRKDIGWRVIKRNANY